MMTFAPSCGDIVSRCHYFFHVRESVSAREGCWLKLFIDCLQGGVVGCWLFKHLMCPLVLFYIPRHVVCCDCNGIGWIATRLVWLYDRMILLRKFSVICLCPPIVSDPVGWRLKYTEVQSQWMAFTQSPSLSNSPKILNNYLIFFIVTVQRLWIFVVCSVIETTFIGERGFRFVRSGVPRGNSPLSISSILS